MKNEIWQPLDCKPHTATISLSLATSYILLYMEKLPPNHLSSHATTRTGVHYVPTAYLRLQNLIRKLLSGEKVEKFLDRLKMVLQVILQNLELT